MTTPEENAATARELIQRVLNEGDIPFADKVLSESYVERIPMPGGTADKAGAIAMFTMMREHDPRHAHRHRGRDRVREQGRGAQHHDRHRHERLMPGLPATGKPFTMGAIDVFTFDDDGMNTEHYGVYDIMGMMRQLGHIPAPTPEQ